ncbi:histidine phosphatase superfamily [Xylariales sp. AK1849]|nr:histidine phosphatase superfamily [Xylariales sp. AK1849]
MLLSLRHSTSVLSLLLPAVVTTAQTVDLAWHAPAQTDINNLTKALNSKGIYGFIFDSSDTPDSEYGVYNWCNMPHVRKSEYVKPSSEFELKYVEVIQRHHKRTPYASNAFPIEPYHWDCDDQGLYYYGQRLSTTDLTSAHAYWVGYTSPINPFVPSGWIGSCQFPQITSGGLDDSRTHGADLYGVYHDLLGFLPSKADGEEWRKSVQYRVTTNQITSQVAGQLIAGMWGLTTEDDVPLLVQASTVDSLEPTYTCTVGNDLFSAIKSSSNPSWAEHLTATSGLYSTLDSISGVPSADSGFHASFDHYFDNLSARQCHAKPLPCNSTTNDCITQDLANTVYRLGQWEYSQIYRDSSQSLAASVNTYGVWVAELAAHLRSVVSGDGGMGTVVYFHNVAHDGSLSRLLSVLQIEQMVWPGMGSEVVFELYEKQTLRDSSYLTKSTSSTNGSGTQSRSGFHVRVLFGGQTLRSSNPSLGLIDLLPIETLLAYFDGLVGNNADLVKGKCDGSISA